MQSVPKGFIGFKRDEKEGPWALLSGAFQYSEDGAQMRIQVLCRHI